MNIQSLIDSLSWIDGVAGGVWIVLSAILIWVLIQIFKDGGAKNYSFRTGLALLIAVWLYPIYTGFFSNLILGEIGNIATLIFTLVFFTQLKQKYPLIAKWMLPQTLWLCVASIYVGLQILNG